MLWLQLAWYAFTGQRIWLELNDTYLYGLVRTVLLDGVALEVGPKGEIIVLPMHRILGIYENYQHGEKSVLERIYQSDSAGVQSCE